MDFDDEVTAVAFDAAASALLVASRSRAMYMSADGDVLGEIALAGNAVVACRFLPLGIGETRSVVGTADGKIFLASPRIDYAVIEVVQPIREFLIDSSMRSFVSVDAAGEAFAWTAMGLPAQGLNISQLARCPRCGGRPVTSCMNCSRAFCETCMGEGSHGWLCLICHAVLCYLCQP
jgi:hypothetical protein